MNKFGLIGLTIALFSACSKLEPPKTETKEIRVSATIAASRSVVSDNDQFDGIVFLRLDDNDDNKTSGFDFSESKPISGRRAADGTVTFAPSQNYDDNNRTTYLLGYYPAGTLESGVVTWKIDGATDLLTTNPWNAGSYTTPHREGMVFIHRLARIEVICQSEANTNPEVMQSIWGDIAAIQFADACPTITYSYATNTLRATEERTDIPLLNKDRYSFDTFVPTPIGESGTTAVTASAMLFPTESNAVKLKITTTKKAEKEITVTLNEAVKAGKIHTITLTFSPDGKQIKCLDTVITPWQTGTSGEGGIPE